MKALSYDSDYAWRILTGEKTIDCRTVPTVYRGPVLICAGSRLKYPERIHGYALCVATLADVTPFAEDHLQAAIMDIMPHGARYAWKLDNILPIQPFKVRGYVGMFDTDVASIDYMYVPQVDDMTADQKASYAEKFYLAYYYPLIRKPRTHGAVYDECIALAAALRENTDLLFDGHPLPPEVDTAMGDTYKRFINGNKPMKGE